MNGLRLVVAVLGLGLAALLNAQEGSLVATIDRDEIRVNESFVYVLRAEGPLSGSPDLSALALDFDVIQSGNRRSVQIVNGATSQVAEWTVELMPRTAGQFVIPPVELDGVLSNPVDVEIRPPAADSGAAADIFLEVEVDRDRVYVQSQVVYTLRLFVGIATGREALVPPPIEDGEAIVETLGSDREYQTVRGDRVYRVRERRFAIFPQTTGALTIGPTEYQATVIPSRGFSRRQTLGSDPVEIDVLPAVPPPPEHAGAAWLPARSLEIVEEWGDGLDRFAEGVPRTRELTVVAEGVLETQLPRLQIGSAQGLRQYADQPELGREVTDAGIVGWRRERLAVIANRPGTIELPRVELPWWNVDQERWEVAAIDATSAIVEPGIADEAPPPPSPSREPPPSVGNDPGFWPWLSALLGIGWLATILAWVLLGRQRPAARRQPAAERRTSARTLLRQLTAACRVGDAPRARDLLLAWAGHQFPDDPPQSLGALAARLDGPLAAAIDELESALYGRHELPWDGAVLAEEIRKTQKVSSSRGGRGDDPLVPLYR